MKLATRQQTGPARAGRGHAAEVVEVDGAPDVVAAVVEEARGLAAEAADHARRGCRAALLAGLRLIWLHRETAADPRANLVPGAVHKSFDVPRGTSKEITFDSALAEIGLPRRTAYRWMTCAGRVMVHEGVGERMEEVEAACPEPGSDGWDEWEHLLTERAEHTSLRRLAMGHVASRTDFHRLEELMDMAERGSRSAEEALEKVDDGSLSLALALRAATGAEATRDKTRRDPVYLEWDPVGGRLKGLLPAALRTAGNGFSRVPERRDELDEGLAIELVNAFRALIQTVPKWVRNFEVK